MEQKTHQHRYEQLVYQVQDYVYSHLDTQLNLAQLAGKCALSPFHFHRIFKSVTGETPYDFIQRIRLEKSCAMLMFNHDMKIINIALASGFATPSSFSKSFKQRFQISPSTYRRQFSLPNRKNGTTKSNTDKDAILPMGYLSDSELERLYRRRKAMNVEVTKIPNYRIAYIREIGPYGERNIKLMQRLKEWAITRDLLVESSIILGVAHDNPQLTPAEKCRYDACIVLPNDYKLEKGINETVIEGGDYAVFSVKHTASELAKTWHDIFAVWLPNSGYQIDNRKMFERYCGSGMEVTLEPDTCEICVPIKCA